MTTEVVIYNFHNKGSPSPLRLLSDTHWEDEAYIYIYIIYIYIAKNISPNVAWIPATRAVLVEGLYLIWGKVKIADWLFKISPFSHWVMEYSNILIFSNIHLGLDSPSQNWILYPLAYSPRLLWVCFQSLRKIYCHFPESDRNKFLKLSHLFALSGP